MDDKRFMKMALDLAARGRGFTSPNPMVGAVIVKDGNVVGKGYHKAAGKAHAEVNAIDDAGMDAKGATLYVNLEPCHHTGRTPPCTEKILSAGIRRVVAAMHDPNPDVRGGGLDYLKSRGLKVAVGICEDQAKRLNEVFIKYVKTKRPFSIIKCAATLDGRIATRTGDSKWVTGEAARKFVHRLRHAVDAIMVGVNTIIRDDPMLTTRLSGGLQKKGLDPTRIVLDTRLRIPESAKLLRPGSDSDTLIICGPSVSAEKKAKLEREGVKIIESPVKDGLIDLDRLMDRLGALGLTSLLIEGGSRVIASSLSAGIAEKIVFFYAPKILGGDDGAPVCRGPGPDLMKGCIAVKNIRVRRFGDDVMIEGYIDKT
ncbi:MAG: bifunctional diaminohydroxyphosphoribosylaminopyrimidine deaminase/5-amino-6-(5-phosphoribosylamino)uracil reductase RibD [Pseudomonadota bacterium]|uniref:Riboflavin biosynthesis protein RibD n=1 Tax=Candidatus Desulfatibia profunda TaxID=2841695 RepID=A0A8J6THD1_9BACT|nr:bifunctional diaminohydroxyphosphoribosylaminopyrimidine deaminase/5-amino-6-(5-phosphoribosylamino)uracil reductase RibD [Candidatus Desulfatibia profunda]MBL7179552.1 bifunctional diaminohydroxyphosphoribosylaminopyrimidine deaminase/5-amino-6-(5-phosphoribosylamino)uracil reductase RibD [Desulfobacterales bacterium]